jgi:hypothetical protein
MQVRLSAVLLILCAALLLGSTLATAVDRPSDTANPTIVAVAGAGVSSGATTLEVDPFYGRAEITAEAKAGGCQFCKQKYPCTSAGAICNDLGCTCRICKGSLRCAR